MGRTYGADIFKKDSYTIAKHLFLRCHYTAVSKSKTEKLTHRIYKSPIRRRYRVVFMRLKGYNFGDIAKRISVSKGRAMQIFNKEMRIMNRAYWY